MPVEPKYPHNQFPDKNTGLKLEPALMGRNYRLSALPYKVVLPKGDWRPYVPQFEPQYNQNTDVQACVSFSNSNIVELQLRQFGHDVNFSDRFLAKMSGTTANGNYFSVVQAANLAYGRVLETAWPAPDNYTWASYYSDIPDTVKKQNGFFDEQSEFISPDLASLKYFLKHTPIQIAIPRINPYHAVALLYINPDTNVLYYFDSEGLSPGIKTMSGPPASAMRIIINPQFMTKRYIINDNGKLGLMILEGFTGTVVFADNQAHFQYLKDAFGFTGNEPTITLP